MLKLNGFCLVLAGIVAVSLLWGCEVSTTGRWWPDPEAGAHATNARRLTAEANLLEPRLAFLWDKTTGKRLAVAAAAKDNKVWAAGHAAADVATVLFGPSLREAQQVTTTTVTATGIWLSAAKMLPVQVANPRRLKVGDVLWRVDWDGQVDVRERLEVIGVASAWFVVTCPRTAQGLIFRGDSGEWLPLVWQLDPQGGCPVLAALDAPPKAQRE